MLEKLEARMQTLIAAREKAAIQYHVLSGAIDECQNTLDMLKETGNGEGQLRNGQGSVPPAGGAEVDQRS